MIELLIIVFLLILNGVFAMAEIALVSSKKSRLQQWAAEGKGGAELALKLGQNPERFLSTVQIGITLISVLSGAFGGASLSGYLVPLVQKAPSIAPYAERISFGLIVAFITFLSVVIGELVPKNLALRNPEKIACFMATPMNLLSRLAYPMVWLLELSTRMLMKLFGKGPVQNGPTAEEVRVLVREGMITGGVLLEESEMVEGVFDLRELRAEEIMRPKPKVVFFHVNDTLEEIVPRVTASRQNVFPVYQETRDNVVGIVSLRDLFTHATKGGRQKVSSLMLEPLFVSDNQPALTLMEQLRKAPHFAALVTDEFGILRGMVTLDDLAEEVVGDLEQDEDKAGSQLRLTAENTWLVDGMMEIDDVADAIEGMHELVDVEKESFQTLAGYIVHKLQRLPHEGEFFEVGDFKFEVLDMDRQRIDKVVIHRKPPVEEEPTEE